MGEWTNFSNTAKSQYTQKPQPRLLHGKPIYENYYVQPSSFNNKTRVGMENSRLNALVNPSRLSIESNINILFNQAPRDGSPGMVMDTKELLGIIQRNSPTIEVMQDDINSTQGLPSTGNPSDRSCLAVDFTSMADTCASLTTDLDDNLSPITVLDNAAKRMKLNQVCETPEDASVDWSEQAHLNNSKDRSTILIQAETTGVSNLPDVKLDEGNKMHIVLNHVSDISPKNNKHTEDRISQDAIDSNKSLTRRLVDPSKTGALKINSGQENPADQTGNQVNSGLTETGCIGHTRSCNVFHNQPNLNDDYEKSPKNKRDVKCDVKLQSSSENLHDQNSNGNLLAQPSVRQSHDQLSHRRKKNKVKNRRGIVMYPIPDPRYFKAFNNYRCTSTIFINPADVDESSESSVNDTQDNLGEERENRIQRQSPVPVDRVVEHNSTSIASSSVSQNNKCMNGHSPTHSPSSKQSQNKFCTNSAISDEFKNGFVKNVCLPPDSASSESTTKTPDISMKTLEASSALSTQNRNFSVKSEPKDLQVSPEFRNRLLQFIHSDS